MADIAAAAEEAKTTIAESRTTLQGNRGHRRRRPQDAGGSRSSADCPRICASRIAELQKSVASVGPDGAMQGDLLRTLDELRASLRSLKAVTTTIDEKPNSLLFGRDSSGNPKPKAPR